MTDPEPIPIAPYAAFGDSITAGGWLADPATEGYIAQLSLRIADPILNYAVGGTALQGGTILSAVQAALAPGMPKFATALIMGGCNDISFFGPGNGLPLSTLDPSFDAAVEIDNTLTAAGVYPVWLGVLPYTIGNLVDPNRVVPINTGGDYLNDKMRLAFPGRFFDTKFIFPRDPNNGFVIPQVMIDGFHPNFQGHTIIANSFDTSLLPSENVEPPQEDSNPEMYCQNNLTRGTIRIIGTDMPNGVYTLSRLTQHSRVFEPLRGAEDQVLTTGGFMHEDTEPPFGEPIRYRFEEELEAALRHIQTNHVTTPAFGRGVGNWVAGPGRTVTTVNDPYYGVVGHVNGNSAGASQGMPGRAIAEVTASGLQGGTTYQITGIVRYSSTDVRRWMDVRDEPVQRSWADLVSYTWEEIRSEKATPDFASLYLSVSNASTNYVTPVLVRQPDVADIGKWLPISVQVTLPVGTPAIASVRLLHGTTLEEYTAEWDLTEFGMMPMSEVGPEYLYWFSGDTPIEGDPAQRMFPDSLMFSLTKDSVIRWDGTPGVSTSTFIGPSQVFTETVCMISVPENWADSGYGSSIFVCSPIHLNDPVQPNLGQWYGLIQIEELEYPARRELHNIIHRAPQIAVNDVRGWENGQMILLTSTLAQRRMSKQILQSGRILQFRNPETKMPEGNEDGPWYISIGDVREVRPFKDHRRPERYWEIPFSRVERPKGLIDAASGSGITWQQVKDTNANWYEVLAFYTDWMDVFLVDKGGAVAPPPLGGGTDIPGLGGRLPTVPAHAAWMKEQLPVP